MAELTIYVAFIAGIISFFSPCCLPLIPGFLAYISGTTITNAKHARLKIFLNSVAFVLGLSLVFATFGVLLNTILANISYIAQNWLSRISGTIIIIFALHLLGLLKIHWLEQEHKFTVKKRFSKTYITSFIFGAAFGLGWVPCVSAILGSILALSITIPGKSFILLLAYAFGLSVSFLVVGLFAGEATKLIRRYSFVLRYFNIIVGVLLLILGVLVFTNTLAWLQILVF